MSKSLIGSSLSLLALMLVVPAQAGQKHHRRVVHHKTVTHHSTVSTFAAENGLIGVHLFDSSEHVIGIYGSPDDIQPLTFGVGQQSGGFGGGSGFGGGPGGMPGGFGGRGGGMGAAPGGGRGMGPASSDEDGPESGSDLRSQFDFGDPFLQMGIPGKRGGGMGGGMVPGPGARGPGSMGGPPGMGGGPMGPGGAPGGFGKGAGMGAGAGAGTGGSGATESVTYTRWIYNRNNNKFAFVVNRLGQVIQIEAIGLSNPKVKTKRGIGFGSKFGTIVKAYHNPDGYDIGGDNILVKYLVHDKVAFRLTRLGDKQPHQVTGIVVSAGKG